MTEPTELTPEGESTLIETDCKIGQDNISINTGPFDLDIHSPSFGCPA